MLKSLRLAVVLVMLMALPQMAGTQQRNLSLGELTITGVSDGTYSKEKETAVGTLVIRTTLDGSWFSASSSSIGDGQLEARGASWVALKDSAGRRTSAKLSKNVSVTLRGKIVNTPRAGSASPTAKAGPESAKGAAGKSRPELAVLSGGARITLTDAARVDGPASVVCDAVYINLKPDSELGPDEQRYYFYSAHNDGQIKFTPLPSKVGQTEKTSEDVLFEATGQELDIYWTGNVPEQPKIAH